MASYRTAGGQRILGGVEHFSNVELNPVNNIKLSAKKYKFDAGSVLVVTSLGNAVFIGISDLDIRLNNNAVFIRNKRDSKFTRDW